jgi:hypothetical protein
VYYNCWKLDNLKKNRCFASMTKKAMIKYVAYLLLFAIQFAAVPFHQVFHKHQSSKTNQKASLTVLKNFEKACCTPFDGIFGTTDPSQLTFSKLNFVRILYIDPISHCAFTSLIQSSNKAPPVAIV